MKAPHFALLWGFGKWRVSSCSYNRQSPIFLEKNEESGPLSDSPLDPLLLVFSVFTDASRWKAGGPYQTVGWDQFCLTSKRGATPLL